MSVVVTGQKFKSPAATEVLQRGCSYDLLTNQTSGRHHVRVLYNIISQQPGYAHSFVATGSDGLRSTYIDDGEPQHVFKLKSLRQFEHLHLKSIFKQ